MNGLRCTHVARLLPKASTRTCLVDILWTPNTRSPRGGARACWDKHRSQLAVNSSDWLAACARRANPQRATRPRARVHTCRTGHQTHVADAIAATRGGDRLVLVACCVAQRGRGALAVAALCWLLADVLQRRAFAKRFADGVRTRRVLLGNELLSEVTLGHFAADQAAEVARFFREVFFEACAAPFKTTRMRSQLQVHT